MATFDSIFCYCCKSVFGEVKSDENTISSATLTVDRVPALLSLTTTYETSD